MHDLLLLRDDHAAAVLEFEVVNRSYFASWISDRGDDFFANFAAQHAARLAEQENNDGAYYLAIDENGTVVGRFNLTLSGDTATLGYRVAEAAAGQGLATTAVRVLCDLAKGRHGCARIVAATSLQNVPSQRVLVKAGFTRVGPADPAEVGGKQGYRYERMLDQR